MNRLVLIQSVAFLFFLFGILSKSDVSMSYARSAMEIWADSMLPALLPCMILSGIMVQMDLAERTASFFAPLMKRVFHCSATGCYCILVGFLCGFPMGSKTVSELFSLGKISKEEAVRLLLFCNNIGPAYLIGFVIPLLHVKYKIPCIIGFYGIPLCYGILLGFCNRKPCNREKSPVFIGPDNFQKSKPLQNAASKSFLCAMDESVRHSMDSMMILGGYMVLFHMLNLIPRGVFGRPQPLWGPLFEISSGLKNLQGGKPIYCLTMLSFGGMCCLAQTNATLRAGNLTEYLGKYSMHKVIQAICTLFYFTLMTFLLPDFFSAP